LREGHYVYLKKGLHCKGYLPVEVKGYDAYD